MFNPELRDTYLSPITCRVILFDSFLVGYKVIATSLDINTTSDLKLKAQLALPLNIFGSEKVTDFLIIADLVSG